MQWLLKRFFLKDKRLSLLLLSALLNGYGSYSYLTIKIFLFILSSVKRDTVISSTKEDKT